MTTCLAEDCANWTGMGCACAFFDLEPVDIREEDQEQPAT